MRARWGTIAAEILARLALPMCAEINGTPAPLPAFEY